MDLLVEELARKGRGMQFEVVPVDPRGRSKVERFDAAVPLIKARRIWLPKDAVWVPVYRDEHCNFPDFGIQRPGRFHLAIRGGRTGTATIQPIAAAARDHLLVHLERHGREHPASFVTRSRAVRIHPQAQVSVRIARMELSTAERHAR